MIAADALKAMTAYHFPGNVRELENTVERCLVLGGRTINAECLPAQIANFRSRASCGESFDIPAEGMDLEAYLDRIEKQYLLLALEKSGNVKKRAAEMLGMSFRSFRYRLAKFGMDEEVTD